MIQALKTVLPIKRKERERRRQTLVLQCSRAEAEEKLAWYERKNQKARARLLRALIESPRADYGLICGKLQITRPVVRALEEAGLVSLVSDRVYRNPVRAAAGGGVLHHLHAAPAGGGQAVRRGLRQGTQAHLSGVRRHRERQDRGLYGHDPQGGGDGRQAVMLIPEIALTWQTVLRFQRMFGDRVSILNSRMSAGERYDQMQRAKKGEIDVMIDPDPPCLRPSRDWGSSSSTRSMRAATRANRCPGTTPGRRPGSGPGWRGPPSCSGRPPPSLEAYRRCKKGEYVLLTLPARAGSGALPKVYVEDMRRELRSGNRSILSDRLRTLLTERLDAGQQAMLFLNRPGLRGLYLLPRLRPCDQMPPLRRVSLRPPGRQACLPLLRV